MKDGWKPCPWPYLPKGPGPLLALGVVAIIVTLTAIEAIAVVAAVVIRLLGS